MKNFLALPIMFLVSLVVYGATLITYDDGSTYTVGEREEVYVSELKVFDKREFADGSAHFKLRKPNWKRDYVKRETSGPAFGTHEWCKEDVVVGTFGWVSWNQYCDTNKDGVYGCGDRIFMESEDAEVCPSS